MKLWFWKDPCKYLYILTTLSTNQEFEPFINQWSNLILSTLFWPFCHMLGFFNFKETNRQFAISQPKNYARVKNYDMVKILNWKLLYQTIHLEELFFKHCCNGLEVIDLAQWQQSSSYKLSYSSVPINNGYHQIYLYDITQSSLEDTSCVSKAVPPIILIYRGQHNQTAQ